MWCGVCVCLGLCGVLFNPILCCCSLKNLLAALSRFGISVLVYPYWARNLYWASYPVKVVTAKYAVLFTLWGIILLVYRAIVNGCKHLFTRVYMCLHLFTRVH